MSRSRRRRATYYLGALVGFVLLYTVLFDWGMSVLEDRPISFLSALVHVVETFTTVGYGEYAPWSHPLMELLVISMMGTGVFFVFMALPLFVAPWIEQRLSTTPPTKGPEDIADHVIICSFTSRSETLIEELESLDVPYLVIEPDRELATELFEVGHQVVHGDSESTETLENARLSTAKTLVADVDDETNASIALAAKSISTDIQIITFVEDPSLTAYHRLAGADQVFSPRQLVGESLANKITTAVSADVGDAIEIGEDFEIVELPVQSGSEIVGKQVAESRIRERTGVDIIGAWFRGDFVSPPPPEAVIDEQTILLVAGQEQQLETLKEMTLSEKRRRRRGNVIIGGYGEVGSIIKERVSSAGIPCVAVDPEGSPGVDIEGDITREEILEEAGLYEASTVILALSDDTMTIFATLVVRERRPEVEIIARADEKDSVRKLYQAGADYVLALATVSGRMLASTILEEDVISFDQQVEMIRFDADGLAGETPASANVRARTGCTVIAVERDGEVITEFDPDFEFERDDSLIVSGPDESITQFSAIFGRA
jgi:Trk K+ transport system NAD-binding subunit